ncbi:MAG: relaxase/mobilization nuclease domain-containing protein [Defluviitaleaceae bacterium]|nr:relaxase/mobilization nuclease domain-containing protein [Defluviitaleaceae bacterium]
MATTWIKALHKSNGRSIASALGKSADYTLDADKTDDGEFIDSYECFPETAQVEFLLSKRLYAQKTGRDQGKNDVIAYHIRMSFKPEEVTAEKALELGKELAMRWTRGKHQFIIAAHTNTNSPHVHIIYNSVNIDCDRKFQDFKGSAFALRRLSDQICLEHGLSVIENPSLPKGYNREEYLNNEKRASARDILRGIIDTHLVQGVSFEDFIMAMKKAGCDVKRGKHLAFKLPNGKRFIRCSSLGDDYIEDVLLKRLSGRRVIVIKAKPVVSATSKIQKPNLLIDIQAKIQEGYGAGFEKWAALRNLKEAAKTLVYLQERGLDNYDVLSEKANAASEVFHNRSGRMADIETRKKEISELQKQIGVYIKTNDILKEYNRLRDSNPSTLSKLVGGQTTAEKFYVENEATIIKCNAAKKYFDQQGFSKDKKLPSIKTLQQEYAILESERGKLRSGYKAEREEMIALVTAKRNVDIFLGELKQETPSHERDAR